MKLTPKKLKVSANINMAYVINYMHKFLGFSYEDAFKKFISAQCYNELCDLNSGLCTAMSPDVLFLFEEDSQIPLNENDDKISAAFDIDAKLQYIVNMTEAFREAEKISPKKFYAYISKNNVWKTLEDNYEKLSSLKREDVIKYLKG